MAHVYGIFGFEFSLELSTRPQKFLGEIAMWDKAEAVCLMKVLISD
jgi:threonyl-tRNA synthetase